MNILKKIVATLRFREAVRRANEAHVRTGQTHHVLPAKDGKLIVMNRKNFRMLRQKGYIRRGACASNLADNSVYSTSACGISEDVYRTRLTRYLRYLDSKKEKIKTSADDRKK